MEEFFKYIKTVLDLPFLRETLLICASVILTHLLNMRRFSKERDTKYHETIGEKVATALIAVREIALSTQKIELYSLSIEHSPADSTNAVNHSAHYPSFMTNTDTLLNMCRSVSAARSVHEPYLDLVSAAYLYVFERYLMNLALYIGKHGYQEDLETLGCLVIVDVQKWYRSFDQHLVKRINCPHYKLFSQSGWLWNITRKKMEKKYLTDTHLNELMRIDSDDLEENDGG